jgi:hypothetical protein
VTGYGVDGHGSIPFRSKGFILFSPQRTDRLWGTPSLLSNGYFPWGEAAGDMKLIAYLRLVPQLPHTSSWRDAQLIKHTHNFAFLPFNDV